MLNGGGGGVKFINDSLVIEVEISELGGDEGGEVDTFGIGLEVGGSEV